MTRTPDGYVLTSGRVLAANCGILGITRRTNGTLEITEGYDGGFSFDAYDAAGPLTPDERVDISRYMVGLWMDWADDHGQIV